VLTKQAKALLIARAPQIVAHPSFTPERINRFVRERLPEIPQALLERPNDEKLLAEVDRAIHNPTERMVKAFRALPSSHKAMLLSLLEAGHWCSTNELEKLYRKHRMKEPFDEVLGELSEAFISIAGATA